MKTPRNGLTILCALFVLPSAQADFAVTLITAVSDTSSQQQVRLFNAGAPGGPGVDPSEIGDPVWLVFDVDGDGIFKNSGGGVAGTPDSNYALSAGTEVAFREAAIDADDYVIYTALPGPLEGRMSLAITGLPSSLQSGGVGANDAGGSVKPAYALLFRSSDFSAGGSFGFDLTAASGLIPQIGNVDLRIGQEVYADAFTFTVGGVVPPSPPTFTNVTARLKGETVEFGFSFFAEAGASYTLLSTTNLADKPIAWTPEGEPFLGANTQTNLSVTNSVPPHQKYYRLEDRRP